VEALAQHAKAASVFKNRIDQTSLATPNIDKLRRAA